ncbi:MAG TPA: hypothetical protein VM348_03930 [Brevundimonas sp.]|nr:hypothetical protein [Brevundimonas sp.]
MAAVTRVKARPVSPPGYEVNDKGKAAVAITAGDLLIITDATPGNGYEKVWDLAPTTTDNAHGIALMDAKAGLIVSVGIQGEMDGFSGMTPGDPLYPSGDVAGGIDTTAPEYYGAATTPEVSVPAQADIRAISATRIRYSFV